MLGGYKLGPYEGSNRANLKKADFLKGISGVVVIFGLIVLYVFEFKHFDLVLKPKWLVLFSFVLGIMLGVRLGKKFSKGVKESFERFRVYTILIFLSIFFMPLLINLSNRLLDFRMPEKVEVSFENIEPYISEKYGVLKGEKIKIAGYKIVVLMDGNPLDLKSKQNPFPNNKPGDIVQIAVHHGLFGLKYIRLAGD